MLEVPWPVTTVYRWPWQRVLFDPIRDANPFFHLFEALWMLAGRNDVAFPAMFVKRMAEFSDDGVMLNGAYGYRWRHHFGRDNLERVVRDLLADRDTRRAYLPIWDGTFDGWRETKDMPCNVGVNFRIRDEKLHMTVFCRSNDILWGCYGANAVHFAFLQEYVAAHVGVGLGPYTQVSDSFHAYCERPDWAKAALITGLDGPYPAYLPLLQAVERPEQIDADLTDFFSGELVRFRTLFFEEVVGPMSMAWTSRNPFLLERPDLDWHKAGRAWLQRRL
jgi:hypothetical protein